MEMSEERIREIVKEEIESWWTRMGEKAKEDMPEEVTCADVLTRNWLSQESHVDSESH